MGRLGFGVGNVRAQHLTRGLFEDLDQSEFDRRFVTCAIVNYDVKTEGTHTHRGSCRPGQVCGVREVLSVADVPEPGGCTCRELQRGRKSCQISNPMGTWKQLLVWKHTKKVRDWWLTWGNDDGARRVVLAARLDQSRPERISAMHRLSVLALTGAAALLVFALSVANASAIEPKFLPETGLTLKGSTIEDTALRTLAGSEVLCKKHTDEVNNEADAGMEGKFKIVFEECKNVATGITCTGEKAGEAAGSITSEGTVVLGRATTKGTGAPVAVFEPNNVKFKCGIVAIEVLGSVACPITPVNTKVKTTEHFTVKCEESAANSGDAKISVAWILSGGVEVEHKTDLLTKIGGGTEESSSERIEGSVSPNVEAMLDA